jgi:hypothetical protein
VNNIIQAIAERDVALRRLEIAELRAKELELERSELRNCWARARALHMAACSLLYEHGIAGDPIKAADMIRKAAGL